MVHRAAAGAARTLRRLTALGLAVGPVVASAQAGGTPAERDATRGQRASTAAFESNRFRDAVARGTRTRTGRPGPRYWQQWTSYSLSADYEPSTGLLRGAARIRHANRSPRALDELWLAVPRGAASRGAAPTPGDSTRVATDPAAVAFVSVRVRGVPAERGGAGAPSYAVDGAALRVALDRPVAPGETVDLELSWTYVVPSDGGPRGGRGDGAHVVADWYPRLAVHDDVAGWHVEREVAAADPLTSRPYAGFGAFDVAITAPAGWLVAATGVLANASDALAGDVAARLARARASDDVVRVVGDADRDAGRAVTAAGPRVTWRFRADSVTDVAFATSDRYRWDAVRVAVPGGGTALAQAFWMPTPDTAQWADAARITRWGVGSHSRTVTAYQRPVATVVMGGDGCDAAFPMLACLAPPAGGDRPAFVRAVLHQLAHQWFPLTVATTDARRPWLDEGFATFNHLEALAAYFKRNDEDARALESYVRIAGTAADRPLLPVAGSLARANADSANADSARADSVEADAPSANASPADSATLALTLATKPALVLRALRGLLGDSMWALAYREYVRRWAFRHPTPYDFLRTVEDVAGQDLGWFWHAWLAGTGTLDQAVASVERDGGRTVVRVESRGTVPMPARVKITRADGAVQHEEIPVQTWLAGERDAELSVPSRPAVVRVEIDPAGEFPDVDRANNVWRREGEGRR